MNDITQVIKYINTLPDCVVYSIVNDSEKTVYINYSTKFRDRFGYISDLRDKLGGRIEFSEIVEHPVYKLILAEKVRKSYLARGYKIKNQGMPFINFKPNLRVDSESRYALVYIVSGKGVKDVVGVFKKLSAAQEFLSLYYGAEWCGSPVIANNELTKRYFEGVVYKRIMSARGSQYFTESNESAAVNGSEE